MIVVIRNPRNGYYGGSVAGPVFRELADMVYANDLSLHSTLDKRQVNFSGSKVPYTLRGSKDATAKVYELLGIKSVNWNAIVKSDTGSSSNNAVAFTANEYKEGIVPNVKGMGLVDAIYAMENAGFKTTVRGKGKVFNQSLAAGQRLKPGTAVLIELN